MSDALDKRLDQILPTITTDEFLQGTGLGNEIAFHIFDYPPEEELRVRKHVQWLLEQIPKKKSGIRVAHVNLFDLLIGYLRRRKYLDKAIKRQQEKEDSAFRRDLLGLLQEQKLAKEFVTVAMPGEHDLVLVSGVGSVYPMLRSHTLLTNLAPIMGQTPLVMFYPGRYDGVSLRLFGKTTLSVGSNSAAGRKQIPYYRAFRLIPEESKYAH